jgi:hypothetical protein
MFQPEIKHHTSASTYSPSNNTKITRPGERNSSTTFTSNTGAIFSSRRI